MKHIKTKTKQQTITTKTYVVELTESEYNWLLAHPNFELYNYGSIWFSGNNRINDPYCGIQVKDCDYKNTVVGVDIDRHLNVVGGASSFSCVTNATNVMSDTSPVFTVKNA